jgi:hypothetical protein
MLGSYFVRAIAVTLTALRCVQNVTVLPELQTKLTLSFAPLRATAN